MIFRSLASLRLAAFLAALLAVSACTDDRLAQLSSVETIDIPAANAGPQANQNIINPTLEIPVTYPVADGDELTLVFEEEFNGPDIRPEVWFFESGDGTQYGIPFPAWGNNELEYYLPDNAMIVNGVLEITARRESVGAYNFTSGRITTQDRFAFKYGRIEASIKLPSGQGLWPAFWMLSQDDEPGSPPGKGIYGVYAQSGEIDIVEAINLDADPAPSGRGGGNELFSTIHFGGDSSLDQNLSTETLYTPSFDVTEDFHTYAFEWDEFEMRWYADGALYKVENFWSSAGGAYPAPFDQPFYILLNLGVGGDFPGSPNGTTPFPATMQVDWVRVYSGEEPPTDPADPGITPDVVVISADPGATPDLVAGTDFTEFTAFSTGGTNDYAFAGDSSYGNVVAVTPGVGYGGGSLGQFGIVGFTNGFATVYDALLFKVKGVVNNTITAKLEEPFPGLSVAVEVDLAAPPAGVTVTDLGDGWSQVVIPIASFGDVSTFSQTVIESIPGAQAVGEAFYLTDIGFNNAAGGTAMGGEVPEALAFSADPGAAPANLLEGTDFTEFTAFSTGGTNDYAFAGDSSYGNVVAVTPGVGYGGGSLGQFGIVGFTNGFATVYDALLFKVKGVVNNTITAKLEEPFPGLSVAVEVDLAAPPAGVTVTDLGDGWSQVVIPIASFGDVSTFSQTVIESIPGAQAVGEAFYLTDIGFNNAAGGTAMGGEVPEALAFSADPGAAPANLLEGTDFTEFTAFTTGGTNDYAFAGDSSYGNVVAVTPGVGYGGGSLGQFGIVGFTNGFATVYDALLFKVKGVVNNTITAKLEEPFPGLSVAVEVDLAAPPAGVTVTDLGDGWSQVVIPIASFGDVSTFSQTVIESIPGAQAVGEAFYLTDIGFNNAGGGTAGNIAINGGFETGLFNDGSPDASWQQFPNGGIQTIVTDNPSEGTYAANLNVPVRGQTDPAVDNLIKNANLEAGFLTPGAEITVTWDMRGSLSGAGGVVFVELFSEFSGGGATGEIYTGGPIFPTADWESFTWNTTLGADVSGGVTLQLKASCGPVEGCGVDAYFDNVTIVID